MLSRQRRRTRPPKVARIHRPAGGAGPAGGGSSSDRGRPGRLDPEKISPAVGTIY